MRRAARPAALLALGLGACAPAADRSPLRVLEGPTMGTTFSVKIVAPDAGDERVAAVRTAVERTLADVDERMSTYRPDSEISRFNAARTTEPFPVSADTLAVFRHALDVSAATNGAFDVTVGPLVDAWGFGPRGPPAALPADAAIARLRRRVGYRRLRIDAAASTVRKLTPDLSVDLSALAKGYAVDKVAELLRAERFDSYLIEVGGEVRAAGRSARGDAWRVGIERPAPGLPAVHRRIPLRGRALATSGDYRNYHELAGRRVSHTIDPRTGRPVAHGLASASVIASSCVRADAVATALSVLGPDEGFELAVERGWAALLIGRKDDGTLYERETPAFTALTGS